ncbi:MAG: hypothetical protein RL305_411, partial [Pseudomonadota bacterium]
YTKMCTFISNNKDCKHGINCRYAHSLNQLRVSNCLFGNSCKKFINDGNISDKNNIDECKFKHPIETDDQFFIRIGLKKEKKSNSLTNITNHNKWTNIFKTSTIPTIESTIPTDKTNSFETTQKIDQEIVLRVPKDLALLAIEIAIKNGNKKIINTTIAKATIAML